MIKWNKKTYARELKKGYWDLEPHFYHYAQFEIFSVFNNIKRMNVDEIKSALYGKFVCEGKPIKKGFYKNFNLIGKILEGIKNDKIKYKKENQ